MIKIKNLSLWFACFVFVFYTSSLDCIDWSFLLSYYFSNLT